MQVYKKIYAILRDLKFLKTTHVLGSCDTRNTLLASDYCRVVNTREQLLSCTLVLMNNN